MRRPQIRIEYLSGPEDGKIVGFSKELVTIGRAEDCDLFIAHDPTVSRHHARLVREGEQVFLEDARSTHGTFVNGQQISGRKELTTDALVRVGNTWLRFAG